MSWVRLDDAFPEHPKVLAAGPLAGWVHVCGIAYCNRNLTDGFVPRAAAHKLADFDHIGVETGGVEGMFSVGYDVDCEDLVQTLCDIRLWKEVDGGYIIHDYLDYQLSRKEILELRKKRSEAGRKGGLKTSRLRGTEASATASATASAQAKPKQDPKPKEANAVPHAPSQTHTPSGSSSVSYIPPSIPVVPDGEDGFENGETQDLVFPGLRDFPEPDPWE
jgi:hypothetical protein